MLYEFEELNEMVLMQTQHVIFGDTFIELSRMGTGIHFSHQRFGGGEVSLEAVGIVDIEVQPGRAASSSRSNHGSVVTRRSKSDFEENIRQPLCSIHFFIELDESFADFDSAFVGHREFQLLMQMIDSSVEGFVAFHYQICAALQTVSEVRKLREKPGISQQIPKPRCQQGVDRDTESLSQRSRNDFFRSVGFQCLSDTCREGKR